jgi:uncharacterized protein (DUF2141 family)
MPLTSKHLVSIAAMAAMAAMAPYAAGAEILVKVTGARNSAGMIGCALFAGDRGFPMNNSGARQQWVAVEAGSATCRFPDVAEGTYAVSVAHDLNGNKRVDTNLFGIPTEGWAVSDNVAPRLRAPRFDEASFRVDGMADVRLELKLVN